MKLLDHCTLSSVTWHMALVCPVCMYSIVPTCYPCAVQHVCLFTASALLLGAPAWSSFREGDLPGDAARSRSRLEVAWVTLQRANLLHAIIFPRSSLTPSQLHGQAWICSLSRNELQLLRLCVDWAFLLPLEIYLPPGWSQKIKSTGRLLLKAIGEAQDFWTKALLPGRRLW